MPLEESDYPLIDPATAFAEVKKGTYGGTQALGVPEPLLAPGDISVRSLPPESAQGETEKSEKLQRTTLEVDQVKLAYLTVPSDDGTWFYQPAYVFSGTIPRLHKVAVPAIDF